MKMDMQMNFSHKLGRQSAVVDAMMAARLENELGTPFKRTGEES